METEKKAEAAGGPDDTVRHWRGELDRAERAQRDWTRRAAKVVERYRAEKRIDGRRRFNILWANTEILKPVIYSQTPAPDVRRRYLDDDPVGREASLVLERALSTCSTTTASTRRWRRCATTCCSPAAASRASSTSR